MASAVCLHLMPSTRKMVMQIKTKQPSTYPTTTLSFLPKTTPNTSTPWGQWTRIVQMPWRNLRGVQRMEYPSLSGWYVSSFYVCLQHIVYGTFTEKTMHACSTVYNCSKVGDHCSLGWHFKFCCVHTGWIQLWNSGCILFPMQPNSMGIDLRDAQCVPFYRKMKELDMVTMGCMSPSESGVHLRGPPPWKTFLPLLFSKVRFHSLWHFILYESLS